MTDVMKNAKTPVVNNVLVPMPEDVGNAVVNLREGAELYQRELSQMLKMRGRTGVSEYERNLITVSKQVFALIAILTDSHPMLKKGEGELVFDVNPKPKKGYKSFVENALANQGITAEELVENEYAQSLKLKVETVNKVLDGETPKDKEWSNIQLALGEYASGFNYAEIINVERNKRGWDQAEIAGLVGITRQSISNYETRKSIPGAHIWAVLLLLFEIHPNYTMIKGEIPETYLDELKIKIKSIESVRENAMA